MDVGNLNKRIIPQQKDVTSSVDCRSFRKALEAIAPDVTRIKSRDRLEFGFLETDNVTRVVRDSGMHGVFAFLVIKP
jgi:hypothetical protein